MNKIIFKLYFTYQYLKTFFQKNPAIIFIILGIILISAGLIDHAFAQTGSEVFKSAASNIACKVVPKKFGAMLTIFAGVFAIVAAAAGSYKGAWALLFVSIGSFIFGEFIKILFKGSIEC